MAQQSQQQHQERPVAADEDTVERIVADLGVLLARAESEEGGASGGAAPPNADNADANNADGDAATIDASRWWSELSAARRSLSQPLSIALVALAKSGKSTLVNALLADDVCPTSNVPETAVVARIVHSSAAAPPRLYLRRRPSGAEGDDDEDDNETEQEDEEDLERAPDAVGAREVRERLAELHRERRAAMMASADDAASSNNDLSPPPPPSAARIVAPIAALAAPDGGGLVGGGPPLRLSIVDTPGPNEAGGEALRREVEGCVLPRADALLYVLDYTKLKTADEQSALSRLAQLRPALLKRLGAEERLLFVVNKTDQVEEALGGLGPEETRAYVAELVTRTVRAALARGGGGGRPQREHNDDADGAEFRLSPRQVLLVSARDALLGRLMLAGRAEPHHLRAFSRAAFGSAGAAAADVSSSTSAASLDAARRMVQASGVPELERRVLGFLAAHAEPVRRLAALDRAEALVARSGNVWLARRAALCAGEGSAGLGRQRAALEAALGGIVSLDCGQEEEGAGGGAQPDELVAVLAQSRELQRQAAGDMRDRVDWIRTLLFQRLTDALDDDDGGGADDGGGHNNNNNHGVDSESAAARWREVRSLFLALMRRDGAVVRSASAGPARVEVVCDGGAAAAAAAAAAEEEGQDDGGHSRRHHHHHRRRYGGCCARRRRHRRGRRGDADEADDDRIPLARVSISSELSALSEGGGGDFSSSAAATADSNNNNGPEPTDHLECAAAALLDLHEAAARAVAADVAAEWPALEAAAMAHAERLSADVNAALARLSARVERAVERAANGEEGEKKAKDEPAAGPSGAVPPPPLLRLDPCAPVRLPPPTPDSFHADLAALLDALRERHERRVVSRETTTWAQQPQQQQQEAAAPNHNRHHHHHRRRRGFGLCRLLRHPDLFFAGLDDGEDDDEAPHRPSYAPPTVFAPPVTTRTTEEFDATAVRVDAAAVRTQLIGAADAACAASAAAVERAVAAYAEGRVSEARRAAASYARSFMAALSPPADGGEGAAAAGSAAGEALLEARCAALEQLRARIGAARAEATAVLDPAHAFERVEATTGDAEGAPGVRAEADLLGLTPSDDGEEEEEGVPPTTTTLAAGDLLMADAPPPPPASAPPPIDEDGSTEEGDDVSAGGSDDGAEGWRLLPATAGGPGPSDGSRR